MHDAQRPDGIYGLFGDGTDNGIFGIFRRSYPNRFEAFQMRSGSKFLHFSDGFYRHYGFIYLPKTRNLPFVTAVRFANSHSEGEKRKAF